MNKLLIPLVFLSVFGIQEANAQLPEFYREDLTFIIDDSSFTVTGYYYFKNNSDENEKFDMLYPFPNREHYGKVTDVYAYKYGNPLQNALLYYSNNTAMINLEIKAGSVTMLRIGYTQELLGRKAEYVLTSTKAWGKSLKEVNYTLIAPENLQIDSLSYLPDFSNTKSGKTIYYYHKEDFMPDREFEV
ncbi:MAG: hypothetical protein V2I47_05545, partial [Bacteroidales bacterium]|nr:hypothetical protein [Bacteroidales bacterium]